MKRRRSDNAIYYWKIVKYEATNMVVLSSHPILLHHSCVCVEWPLITAVTSHSNGTLLWSEFLLSAKYETEYDRIDSLISAHYKLFIAIFGEPKQSFSPKCTSSPFTTQMSERDEMTHDRCSHDRGSGRTHTWINQKEETTKRDDNLS